MSSEDEMLGNDGEPQPSTSRKMFRRMTKRTVMTPSPIRNSDSPDDSDASVENPCPPKKKRSKTLVSKKRGHSGGGENNGDTESANKRKKSSKEPASSDSDTDFGNENSGKSTAPMNSAKASIRRKKRDPKAIPTSRSQPARKKTPTISAPISRTQPASPSQRSAPGSQSMFSQNQLTSHPGVIKSLHLTNFMCHHDFTHNFHPNLNFITGQNGSGKSALLSGILIALGGKAAVTSRTNSLKALVQKGKNTARVAVTLLNTNGLRRYGDEITIERHISVSGTSGYRIKSSGGEDDECIFNWRPLKKTELDRILLGLNIQIDNPVAVLNQEIARSFLRSKDPKVKFNLFYDGTLLSKLEKVIKEAKVEIDETKIILEHQRQVLNSLKDDILALQQKCNKIAELDQIRKKCAEVRGEYLWAVVKEQEDSMEKLNNSMASATKEIELIQKRLEKLKNNLSQTSEESLINEEKEVAEKVEEKQAEVNETRAEYSEVRKKFANLNAKLKTIVSTVQNKEAQYKKLSESLEKQKAEQESRAKEETNEDEEALNKMQAKRKQIESVMMSLKSDSDNFQQASEQERDNLHQLESEVRGLRTQIEGKRRNITALSSRNFNKYSVFGPKMEQLMTKVQANMHKFRRPPKGPLGACFRVKNPAYATILEGVLWHHLDSFVVGDSRDLNLLRELIDSVYNDRGASQSQRRPMAPGGKRPTIHCMDYADQMYDISRHHASHPSAPSILDLIEVENDDHIVMNALIDVGEIERQIVFKDTDSAAQVLKHEETAPKSLRCAYTLNWYKFTPAPHYAARVMTQRSRNAILKSGKSKEAEVQALKSEIKSLEQEIRELEPRKNAIKSKEDSFRKRLEEKTKEINDMRRKLGELVNEIKRQQAKMKEKSKQCDFTSWYEELADLKDELNKQMTERDATTKELEPLKPKLTELENKRKLLDEEMKELEKKIEHFQESRDRLAERRLEISNTIKKTQAIISSKEAIKSELTRSLKAKESELKEKVESAMNECPQRVETRRSSEAVKKEFEGIKYRIQETQNQLGDVDVLQANLRKSQEKFKVLKDEFVPLYKMHKVVEQTNLDQHKSFEKMKSHMGRTLTYFFSSMAKQRGYEGRLLTDFTTKELYYFVCPDGDSASKTLKAMDAQERQTGPRSAEQIKQSKTLKKALVEYSLGLSGGERSFATICFIMALWQVMECPFYMLDEFDVFMDAFNRKTSQLALMAHAKRFCQNQFVLFTPLDLGELPAPEDACVLRLFPPLRSGGSGGAGSGGINPGGGGDSGPQGGNAPSQGTSSSGGRRKGGKSPNESTENIDPLETVSQGKGDSRPRGKQRRQASGTVMGLIQ